MIIKKFEVGDILEMKKPHPCGTNRMKVLRVGSDIRILCVRDGDRRRLTEREIGKEKERIGKQACAGYAHAA